MELAAGTVVERYTVEARLGTGGMAVVYLVRHNQLGTLHAMKVLSLPTGAIRRRLREEGRLQGALRHPNVVAVTDMVDVDGCPALVMEYVAGPSLADLLTEDRPTPAQADDLGRGILLGVEAAHRRGLVHRDVKPGNVLISVESGFPVPKIADFGLAKLLEADGDRDVQTRSGATLGTPAYMAPEQIRDAKTVDHRADLFSLGAVLYELVTGTRTFRGADTLELLQNVAHVRYTPVRELAPKVPKRMAEAIEAALVGDPAARVQDCSTLLSLWTGGERRPWSGDAWDQVAMFKMETLGAAKAAPRALPPAAPVGATTFTLKTIASETVSVDQVTFQVLPLDPVRFEMEEGREIDLTGGLHVATAPLGRDLAATLGHGEPGAGPVAGLTWEEAVLLCNRLSERTGVAPAYRLGEERPRRAVTIDDAGRALYDLVPFERLGPILKAFGADALAVLQHEPDRLAEVEGIGPKTARRIAQAWDRFRFYAPGVERVAEADGWRLPTEAEWAWIASVVPPPTDGWEWTADADPGPVFVDRPSPLARGRFTDPVAASGPLRIVRRRGERGVRAPETRAEDLSFRVVRRPA